MTANKERPRRMKWIRKDKSTRRRRRKENEQERRGDSQKVGGEQQEWNKIRDIRKTFKSRIIKR